jgi:Fe-S-cluster containining protein
MQRSPCETPYLCAAESVILAVMRLPEGDQELVQIMDAALAETARRAGDWLACRPGCTQCCHGAFAIGPLDALRLGAGMDALRTQEPALAAEIERRAQAWLDEHGADFPGDRETGLLGDSDADRERFEEFANEAACPALDPATGLCGVYESRPMTCRVFGPPVRMEGGMEGAEGLGHCELCFVGASPQQVAACEMPVPLELEAKLLDGLALQGETVVAFALMGRGVARSR